MINKTSRFFILIICIFLVFGCSKNRFKKNSDLHVFTFGFSGYDDYQFCKKLNPDFIKYKNGVDPLRSCRNYQYYTCHINHYCDGDKQCEQEAKEYWLGNDWISQKSGKLINSIEWHKTYCTRVEQQCSSAKSGDQTCRR